MKIEISEKLRPYSHLAGSKTILPGNGYLIQAFPRCLKIPALKEELFLDLQAPIEQFTLFNDLEKQALVISGKSALGWFRYTLVSNLLGGVRLIVQKAPPDGIFMRSSREEKVLHQGDGVDLGFSDAAFQSFSSPSGERLFLGRSKAQDWDQVMRRGDLTEVFPVWHRLGQLLPSQSEQEAEGGTLDLLNACKIAASKGAPEKTMLLWNHLFKSGFSSLLAPRLDDEDYLGFIYRPLVNETLSPLLLLTEGSRLIRDLFVQQKERNLIILPHLLPLFPCGSFVNLELPAGKLSLEWTKKRIRRLLFNPSHDGEFSFSFRSDVRSHRLRRSTKQKGLRVRCGENLLLSKNSCYFFDNFE